MKDKLIKSGYKLYLNVTGGAFGVFDEIRKIGETSKFFVGGQIPYAMDLSQKLIQDSEDRPYTGKALSPVVSRRLAIDACNRAKESEMKGHSLGIGVTASLCKSKDEREERINQAWVSAYDGKTMWDLHVKMNIAKEAFWPDLEKIRGEQERFLSEGIVEWVEKILDGEDKGVSWSEFEYTPDESQLTADGELVVYMGSFDPWHEAHQFILDHSAELTGADPVVGIAKYPRGKFELDPATLYERVGAIDSPIAVLDSGLYAFAFEKLRKYSPSGKVIFVVGMDTWERVQEDYSTWDVNPEWEEHCRFLVFPRHEKGLDESGGAMYHLVHNKSEETKHPPKISSTEIRNAQIGA